MAEDESDQKDDPNALPTREIETPPPQGIQLTALQPFLPLAEAYVDIKRRELEHNLRINELQISGDMQSDERTFHMDMKRMELEQRRFDRSFYLLSFIVVAIIVIAAAIIFIRNDVDAGLKVLSYVGTAILALLAGSGLRRALKIEVSQPISNDESDGE